MWRSPGMSFNDYRDLDVWQLARQLVRRTYDATRNFPDTERFGLTSQLRRAAISVPSNVAEGWGRHYTAEFVQFLRKASGSRAELETQLILAADLGYLKASDVGDLLQITARVGMMLLSLERSLLRRARTACAGNPDQETPSG